MLSLAQASGSLAPNSILHGFHMFSRLHLLTQYNQKFSISHVFFEMRHLASGLRHSTASAKGQIRFFLKKQLLIPSHPHPVRVHVKSNHVPLSTLGTVLKSSVNCITAANRIKRFHRQTNLWGEGKHKSNCVPCIFPCFFFLPSWCLLMHLPQQHKPSRKRPSAWAAGLRLLDTSSHLSCNFLSSSWEVNMAESYLQEGSRILVTIIWGHFLSTAETCLQEKCHMLAEWNSIT